MKKTINHKYPIKTRNFYRKAARLFLLTVLIYSAIFNYSAAVEITDAGKYLEDNVIHRKLDNGINVIMLKRGYSPALALIISFKVGSADESYRTMGTAHMLEHMLFKGTDKIGTKDFEKEKKIIEEIEEVGEKLDRLRREEPNNPKIGELEKRLDELQKEHSKYVISSPYSKIYTENGGVGFNASTSRDKTAYYIELPADKLELWAELESERLRNPVFREFYLERNAVFEERLMRYESDGSSNLFEKFIAVSFIAHPYRHPIIGWKSNIKNYSVDMLKKFYETHYITSRMTITIVGKHDPVESIKTLEKYFGKLPVKKEPQPVAVKEPEQNGERRVEVFFEANPYLLMGWHKPTVPAREDYVFDVISSLLSDGKSSRLYKNLVLDRGIAASVQSWNGFPGARFDNLFVIAAEPKYPHTTGEVENAVYAEIERLQNDLEKKEIDNVLNRMESSFIFSLDSNSGIAQTLSYYQTVFDNWKYGVNYLKVIKTISIDEIKTALKKFITEKNRTVAVLRDSRKENQK